MDAGRRKVVGADQSSNVVVPIIKANELTIFHPPIGKGSFGKVYRGKCRGNDVAVKVLDGIEWNASVLNEFTREIDIMARILHPNVLLCMGACTEEEFGKNNYAIIMEYMPRGELHTILHNPDIELTLPRKFQFAIDIAQGMAWLAEANIWHRDLKPANVLVDQNWTCKICDFGLSQVQRGKEKRRDKEEAPGSVLWMAPEVLLNENIDGKLDVYSYGLLLWEVLTREDLFAEYDDKDIFTEDIARNKIRPPLDGIHPALQNIISRAWQHDSAGRPSFQEILVLIEKAILDIYLPKELCPDAAKLWSKIGGKLKVKFTDFATHFFRYLGKRIRLIPDQIKCAEEILSEKDQNSELYVSIERFSSCLKWFGKMKQEGNFTVTDNIEKTLKNDWFFGDTIESKAAESKLKEYHDSYNQMGKKTSVFLVRLNMGGSIPIEQSPFTISRIDDNGKLFHMRVYPNKKGGGFFVQANKENKISHKGTITDFINYARRETDLFKTVSPGWPYRHIFASSEMEGKYQAAKEESDDDSDD